MINMFEVNETNKMITQENLDVRTITMGISLLDCISDDLEQLNQNIYDKILRLAHDLVPTGEAIEREYGIPIVNKRISVTPVALVGGNACKTPEDFVTIAKTLDKAAHEVGVNFIGGYSALVSKGMTKNDENLIRSIPEALAVTERICSSVNVGSTKCGINMPSVSWAISSRRQQNGQKTGILWAAQNWWFSVMLRMTIPSWQVLFMV